MKVSEHDAIGPNGMRKIHIIPVSEWREIHHSGMRTQPRVGETALLHGKPMRIEAVTVSVDSRREAFASVKLVALSPAQCVHCEGWGCRRCSPVVSAPQRPGPQPEPLKRDPVLSLEPVRDLSLEDQRLIQAHSPGAMAMTSHKPGIYPVGSELWQTMFAGYRTDTKRRPFDLTLWRKSRTGHYVFIESTTVSAVDGFEAARIAALKWNLSFYDWQSTDPHRSRPPYIIRNDTPEAP